MTITVEQQGDRWIASDGTHHAEGNDAADAVLTILTALADPCGIVESLSDQLDAASNRDFEDEIGQRCLTLIRLAAKGAPKVFFENEVRQISRIVDSMDD